MLLNFKDTLLQHSPGKLLGLKSDSGSDKSNQKEINTEVL